MAKEKGATVFDKLCHRVFAANGNGANYRSAPTGVHCGHCGTELEFYYCEERLYVIECHRCKTRALVEAGNAAQAAYKTFGYEVHDVDEMGEETAVFWNHLPIDEVPCYVGTTISCDFPDDVVCGMYLPCPGTSGEELEEKHETD